MDNLKYKIWDMEKAKWLDPNVAVICNFSVHDNYMDFLDGDTNNDAKMILWTGEKDVAGKLVFEGDILQPSNRANEFYPVVYKDAAFQREFTFTRKYQGESWQETSYFPLYARNHRVIGNIYDNPDLLESRGEENGN